MPSIFVRGLVLLLLALPGLARAEDVDVCAHATGVSDTVAVALERRLALTFASLDLRPSPRGRVEPDGSQAADALLQPEACGALGPVEGLRWLNLDVACGDERCSLMLATGRTSPAPLDVTALVVKNTEVLVAASRAVTELLAPPPAEGVAAPEAGPVLPEEPVAADAPAPLPSEPPQPPPLAPAPALPPATSEVPSSSAPRLRERNPRKVAAIAAGWSLFAAGYVTQIGVTASTCGEYTYFGESICYSGETAYGAIPLAGGLVAATTLVNSWSGIVIGQDDETKLIALGAAEATVQVAGLVTAIVGHAMRRPGHERRPVAWVPTATLQQGRFTIGVRRSL